MRILVVVLLLFASCSMPRLKTSGPAEWVNPFIGTGGEMNKGFGNMFPGAAYPFGMIQLSPDNGGHGWQYSSGYRYADKYIAGFSHTHLSGTGVADFCDISVMPTIKTIDEKYFVQDDSTINQIIEEQKLDPKGFIMRDGHPGPFDKHFFLKYRSAFSHDQENASPGYYSVKLLDDNIDVELTTAELAAMHRYHFQKATELQHLILNLGFTTSDHTTDAQINIRSTDLITGYRFSTGKANVQRVYFAMQFSRPMLGNKFFLSEKALAPNRAQGRNLAGVFSFDGTKGDELRVKVAISSVSEEGALANLKTADQFGWNFDQMRQSARERWNQELSKINIVTSDPTKKTIFYTSLYHCFLAPYRFSDANGFYKNFNHEAEKAEGYTHYSLLSLWDTFRAENPLLTLFQPRIEENIIHSMLAKYRQTGELPYWEISGNEGGSMIGYHAAVLMADAVAKNLGSYDLEEMYKALVAVSETNRKGLGFYREFQFVPTDKEKGGTVSKTLEYCFDDWCIAQIAKQLGKESDYQKYMRRSQYYKNLFDPEYRLFRGKNSDGSWYQPFHPRFAEYGNPHCVEGNTWQYSFFVPHDPEGLIDLMGGTKGFEQMLDSLLTQTSELLGDDTEDVTGLIGQYAHGNEPSHSTAYLYNFVDKPGKTQFYTNKIINTLYQNTPEGLCGNEDCGQMSAWYVFSAIGLYPVNPVDGRYYFGSPQFEKTEMHLPNGKVFTILAKDVSPENIYSKTVTLNGKPIDRLFVIWDEIQAGGTLQFNMTDKN
ncbi:MAG: GH92 family glycosyl hydrolase [Prolixibacteraceae bacterium]|nr:GH92 family glycosyl hydrolase [Prolixibacteraceae bacterium]